MAAHHYYKTQTARQRFDSLYQVRNGEAHAHLENKFAVTHTFVTSKQGTD
jgi:hypothetical protein